MNLYFKLIGESRRKMWHPWVFSHGMSLQSNTYTNWNLSLMKSSYIMQNYIFTIIQNIHNQQGKISVTIKVNNNLICSPQPKKEKEIFWWKKNWICLLLCQQSFALVFLATFFFGKQKLKPILMAPRAGKMENHYENGKPVWTEPKQPKHPSIVGGGPNASHNRFFFHLQNVIWPVFSLCRGRG
jgi:hypothetical protein